MFNNRVWRIKLPFSNGFQFSHFCTCELARVCIPFLMAKFFMCAESKQSNSRESLNTRDQRVNVP